MRRAILINIEVNLPPLSTEEKLKIAMEPLGKVYDTQMSMDLWQKIGELTGQREKE